MTKPDLTEFDLFELHDEIERRRKSMIDERTAKLRRLSAFVKEHQEAMRFFFELGGCSRPQECVDALIVEEWEAPHSVPVAYTKRFRDDDDGNFSTMGYSQ